MDTAVLDRMWNQLRQQYGVYPAAGCRRMLGVGKREEP